MNTFHSQYSNSAAIAWNNFCLSIPDKKIFFLTFLSATSDNLEAISEAASSHSVGSDMDDNENDNLSDMVSANVSGRGTPNISGRDTPVSQVSPSISA